MMNQDQRFQRLLTRIGHRIKLARTDLGLSQRALGQQIGMSRQTIGRIERGALPSNISFYFRLSILLGIPLDALISEY